ncbi:DedA family protein [Alteraurantiacibacter aquimixticola]|uniref:DedA family protein n=1 Tax=Alteraurantiacibacter aquimixticola TaxID=2489173 RepID=A0A4T3F3K4_9SPHN|nr:DedA family protein [Alteraurantiacibacter aquimixticola]TIX50088.1 DedA family protein [Alteraurantiacibacter aquimixticola]
MEQLIIEAIRQGGYVGIFLLMVLENVVPPVPSEVIMGIGGLLVERGEMQFWPLLLIGTAGTVVGNYFWYWIGDKWGFERLEPFIDRWGRWLTVDWEQLVRAQVFFARHGHWVIFFLRFSPFLRTIISLPAGLTHMPKVKFLFFTFAGSLIWNAGLIKGGEWLAGYLAESEHIIGWLIIGFVVLGAVGYLYRVLTWHPREPSED